MITKITPVGTLKQMFLEIFFNKTDAVSDVSSESVTNAIAYGCSKIGEKILVNQAIIEGHDNPDVAYGIYLDALAKKRGVAARFAASGSSTYIRLSGDVGTVYLKALNKFQSTSGIDFVLENDTTIGVNGYTYAKIKSVQSGSNTNSDPLTINKVLPSPSGHIACTNEYKALGGRDFEEDSLFRLRIKEDINRLSKTTLSFLEQVFMKINNNVLKVYKGGVDSDGKLNLIVVSVNGVDFTEAEFDLLLSKVEEYLSLYELMYHYSGSPLKLKNPTWLLIDVDFRADIDPSYDFDSVRKDIQIQMAKLFDYRFWKYGDKVEWENLFFVAKNVDGVRYVPDIHFKPKSDINVPEYKIPRIRGFVIRDLNGNIMEDNNGILTSFYYPNEIDESFQQSVIATI